MSLSEWIAQLWARLFPSPDWKLTGNFGGKPVVVSMNKRFGAAIYSLKWGGVKMLDSTDHGRELQTAYQLDGMGEAQNPTEAGSSTDSLWISSTKVIFASVLSPTIISTSVNPAYWNVYNGQKTSPDTLTRTITLGHQGLANVIRHQISINLALSHSQIAVEGITGYMPRTFTKFYTVVKSNLVPMITPPSTGYHIEGASVPVIAATPDLTLAIGFYCPNPAYTYAWGTIDGWPKLDSAWWDKTPAPAGPYSYETFTVFGTVNQVLDSIRKLQAPAVA